MLSHFPPAAVFKTFHPHSNAVAQIGSVSGWHLWVAPRGQAGVRQPSAGLILSTQIQTRLRITILKSVMLLLLLMVICGRLATEDGNHSQSWGKHLCGKKLQEKKPATSRNVTLRDINSIRIGLFLPATAGISARPGASDEAADN